MQAPQNLDVQILRISGAGRYKAAATSGRIGRMAASLPSLGAGLPGSHCHSPPPLAMLEHLARLRDTHAMLQQQQRRRESFARRPRDPTGEAHDQIHWRRDHRRWNRRCHWCSKNGRAGSRKEIGLRSSPALFRGIGPVTGDKSSADPISARVPDALTPPRLWTNDMTEVIETSRKEREVGKSCRNAPGIS